MITCDLCKKEIKKARVVPPEYRTDDCREICFNCYSTLFAEIGTIETKSKKDKQDKVKKIIEGMQSK